MGGNQRAATPARTPGCGRWRAGAGQLWEGRPAQAGALAVGTTHEASAPVLASLKVPRASTPSRLSAFRHTDRPRCRATEGARASACVAGAATRRGRWAGPPAPSVRACPLQPWRVEGCPSSSHTSVRGAVRSIKGCTMSSTAGTPPARTSRVQLLRRAGLCRRGRCKGGGLALRWWAEAGPWPALQRRAAAPPMTSQPVG